MWDGSRGGESLAHAGERADRVLARADAVEGAVLLFGHGHALRILVARWLGLAPDQGRVFALATSTVTVLGFEREQRVLLRFNA